MDPVTSLQLSPAQVASSAPRRVVNPPKMKLMRLGVVTATKSRIGLGVVTRAVVPTGRPLPLFFGWTVLVRMNTGACGHSATGLAPSTVYPCRTSVSTELCKEARAAPASSPVLGSTYRQIATSLRPVSLA